MPAITIKNIPQDLYQKLKHFAEIHHRSVNGEVIHCLEMVLTPTRIATDEHLAAAARIRAELKGIRVTETDLKEAKRKGRP